MFPIDKRTVQSVMYPAPDVVPQILFAIDRVPLAAWDECETLEQLEDVMAHYLKDEGARPWDFRWSMERHFSEPYGPLPKAGEAFMAGVPDMFLSGTPTASSETAARLREEGLLDEQVAMNRVRQSDVEVLADPYQYEPGDEMPPQYQEWLEKLMFAHGECMDPYFGEAALGHEEMFGKLDQWSIAMSPDPETRLRFSNFKNEEFRHQYQFLKVYTEFDPGLPFRIYEYEQDVFRAYQSMVMEQTWVDRCINNMLSDRFGVYQGFEWVQSSYAPLARVSLKVVKDERGHSNMGYLSLRACLERDGEDARVKAQQRLDEYWVPYFLAAFGSDTSTNNRAWRQWGLKQHTNPQLRQAYYEEVVQVLDSLGLTTPDAAVALGRGREMARKASSATSH